MKIEREQIGLTQHYKGHDITVHSMPIDVLLRVNGNDLGTYIDAEAARKGGMRYINQKVRDKEKKEPSE